MAIIVDPDNLDRQQIIFGTLTQEVSFYPVGGLRFSSAVDGAVVVGGSPALHNDFTSTAYTFEADDVGKHIIIQTGNNIGSYQIITFVDANTVEVDRDFAITESTITFNVSGASSDGSTTITDLDGDFITDGVTVGDILNVYNGAEAGHYSITARTATTITVDTFDGFTGFAIHDVGSPDTEFLAYTVQLSSGGSAADGASLQSLYSFGKEEWRVDSMQYATDDLIKHEFPFEAITSEQFEIGGGASHFDWTWHNGPLNTDETIHYIRTGGWADKDNAGTTLFEYTGIITLGSVDADAQVYYQQVDENEPPIDFVLPGIVNQAILVRDTTGSPDTDLRTYLKLFVRKKFRSYAGSEIADIGVTTIQTIVNRFPLAHVTDAAITDIDGDVVSTSPFVNAITARSLGGASTDGITVAGTGTFTSATAVFQTSGVKVGDTLTLVSGATASDLVAWHVIAVVSETELTVSIADATFVGDTVITFTVSSKEIVGDNTDGAILDVDSVTGTLTSTAVGDFAAAGVAVGDMLVITEPASDHRGVYKVTAVATTLLTLDTSDKAFTTQTNMDFHIVEPSMFLQFKSEAVTLAAVGTLTFADANPDTIVRSAGDWTADGVLVGDVITITGTLLNDGRYTAAIVGTTTLTLVATDTLVAEAIAVVPTMRRHFTRTIAGVVYAFSWRLFGNDALAIDAFQFIQHQLRQDSDIDWGPGVSRGDVTDLLMTYATPTGTTIDLIIDDINNADLNNVTFGDATGVGRLFAFVAAGTLSFNDNLQADSDAKYWMFFTNDDAPGDNLGFDYGTKNAIIVNDADSIPITGTVGGAPSVGFTFDYDFNVQRGSGSGGSDAAVTIVAIGLNNAQFVITTGTLARSKANNFSLVAALERNYSNP